MKQFIVAVLAAMVASLPAQAGYETGAAYQVLREPAAGGRPTFGALDLSQSAATTNQLPSSRGGTAQNWSGSSGRPKVASGTWSLANIDLTSEITGTLPHGNGGTDVASPGSVGNELVSDGTNWTSAAVHGVAGIRNFGLKTSVGSNALTLTVTQADGSTNCSSTSACLASFPIITASHPSGGYVQRTLAGASSLVVPSSATLGSANGLGYYYYIYLLDNAGTIEPAISMAWFDCTNVVSSTTISSSATSNHVIYSTTGRSNVACRIIGQIQATETTAGTWATNASDVTVGSYKRIMPMASAGVTGTVGGSLSSSYGTNNTISANLIDPFNMASGSNWIAPENGIYHMTGQFDINGTFTAGQYVGCRIGNNTTSQYSYSFTRAYGSVTTDFCTNECSGDFQASAGDTLMLSSITQATGSPTFSSNLCQNFISIIKVSDK